MHKNVKISFIKSEKKVKTRFTPFLRLTLARAQFISWWGPTPFNCSPLRCDSKTLPGRGGNVENKKVEWYFVEYKNPQMWDRNHKIVWRTILDQIWPSKWYFEPYFNMFQIQFFFLRTYIRILTDHKWYAEWKLRNTALPIRCSRPFPNPCWRKTLAHWATVWSNFLEGKSKWTS